MRAIHNARNNGEYLTPSTPRPLPNPINHLQILHPGYPSLNTIIRLPILDLVDDSDPPRFGFHHGTALMICFVITGNRPGFLSPTRIVSEDPNEVVNPPPESPGFDSILLESSYYYYIYSARLDEKYQVLHDPEAWSFPTIENQMGFHWQNWLEVFGETRSPPGDRLTTNVSALVKARDGACRLTGTLAICGCRSAHIIPQDMDEWFIENEMETFAKESKHEENPTTRLSNMCVLRNDIHWMFDQHMFTFVPKQGQLVVHFFDIEPLPACRAFHNASINQPGDLAGEYLLARLAVAVILMTRTFNQRYGNLSIKPTKKRTRGQSSKERGSKKPKPVEDDKNGSSSPSSVVSTRSDVGADLVDEERELEEDMKLATLRLPYIFRPDLVEANPKLACPDAYRSHQVDTLEWYPGHRKVQRMKEAYIATNPQVRATSSGSSRDRDSSGT